jgi:hypothetical protein
MDRTELTRVARILWPYLALWLVVAAALVGFAGYELRHHREAALGAGRAEAENLARVMSEHMQQVLDSADRTLTLAKIVHEHRLAQEPLGAITDAMKPMHGTEAERRINLFDRDGRFVASTDRHLQRSGVSVADRNYFMLARVGSDTTLYIGEAVLGRVSRSTRSASCTCSARFVSASVPRSASRIATARCSRGAMPAPPPRRRRRSARSCRPITSSRCPWSRAPSSSRSHRCPRTSFWPAIAASSSRRSPSSRRRSRR